VATAPDRAHTAAASARTYLEIIGSSGSRRARDDSQTHDTAARIWLPCRLDNAG
jgi:hypothetical protein